MQHKRTPHILSTSANLVGFCLVVLTSIKISKMDNVTVIDELTALAILFFMGSCLLSFLSMRNETGTSYQLEKAADVIFLLGLTVLFVSTMIITFDFLT